MVDLDLPRRVATAHPAASMFVGGQWVPSLSDRRMSTRNPATGEVLAEVADGDEHDVDRAVVAARAALAGGWRTSSPSVRHRLLVRLADQLEQRGEEFATLESMDMGAPLSRTRATVDRAVQMLHWYASQALGIQGRTIDTSAPGRFATYTLKEPVGVVAAIIPWNSPTTSAVWKLGPALATGCAIVLKPAEDASLVPLELASLCLEEGVPAGVVNVVTGQGQVVGERLAAHPGVDKVAFTGSRVTGARVAAAAARSNLKRVSLELGGKSANIVLADADLDIAVPGAAAACFANSGQICSAGTRLFVQADIHQEFVDALVAHTATLRVGDPLSEATDLGPLVSSRQQAAVSATIARAQDEGATVMSAGTEPSEPRLAGGYFQAPTVLGDVADDMEVVREEIFGPVLTVLPFATPEEVLTRANASKYGLGAGVWTRDVGTAHEMVAGLHAGTVWVNCYQQMDAAMPFGGYKESGYGREGGTEHVEEYLNTKAVWIRFG